MAKITTYLSDDELAATRRIAVEQGASLSLVFRLAIRHLLGLPIPSVYRSLVDESRDDHPPDGLGTR